MSIDRDQWQPPRQAGSTAPERADPARPERTPNALGGSLLLEQPRYAALRAEIAAFVAPGPPLAVEVGFDHGINLLAHAHAFPDWRWLGVELRRHRVAAVRDNAPANCLPLRLDARTLFAALLPAGRVGRVDILFPTPALRPSHHFFTPAFRDDVARSLSDDGVFLLRTDVPGLYEHVRALFAGWPTRPEPPRTADLSRRERVCQRDGLPTWTLVVGPPGR
ncbi:MAG: tRNA ((7)-)-methyltransferase [Pseudomonadota bacterium]|jgi:tRNA G46 methylase TrmB